MISSTAPHKVVDQWMLNDFEVTLYKVGYKQGSSASPQTSRQLDTYLYNRPDHLRTQTTGSLYTFCLQDRQTGDLLALIHVIIDEARLMWSPAMAPFGGIQCAADNSHSALSFLLVCIEQWARAQRVAAITIKTAPAAYQPTQHEMLHQLYQQAGYVPLEQFTNHHITVQDSSFTELLSGAERRRLRKCRNAGIIARLWDNPDPEAVYTFINSSRQEQGYPLTLPREKLLDLLNLFPAEVLVFGVYDGETIAALTVAIRVNRDIIYNFLPADNLQYRTYSPTLMLNEALYKYCQQEEVKVLDLGISLDHHGQPKPSLARFKERLGGNGSPKITYRKELW